ncbi:MAG: DUF4097 family beta strand repeat protein [Bdellovibrionales bacterium]|nr:DUF4097 family beta strand repeat protein [Bdellovibrionales bacterium]
MKYGLATTLTLFAVAAAAATHSSPIQRTIDAKGVKEIEVEMSSTDIRITPSSDAQIHVDIHGVVSTQKVDLATKLSGGKLTMSLKGERELTANDLKEEGDMELRIPASIKGLVVKTTSGDIDLVRTILDKVSLNTVSGDAELDDVKIGAIHWQTVSGDWESDSGISGFEGKSTSGDYEFILRSADPRLKLTSTSGDLKMKFSAAPDLKLDFRTTSGQSKIRTAQLSQEGKATNAKLGQGKGSLDFSSVSGSMTIEQ